MAIFKKTVQPPPTATNVADDIGDAEKSYETVNLENTAANDPQRHPDLDPVLEKKLLRKLDWNVVLLVTLLCELQHQLHSSPRLFF